MTDKKVSQKRRSEIYSRIAELRKNVDGSGRGAPAFDSAEVETMALISELQDLGNQELVHEHNLLSEQTVKLKGATTRLTWATWILFFATLVLSFVSVYEILKHG
jgi:hypothetical protein